MYLLKKNIQVVTACYFPGTLCFSCRFALLFICTQLPRQSKAPTPQGLSAEWIFQNPRNLSTQSLFFLVWKPHFTCWYQAPAEGTCRFKLIAANPVGDIIVTGVFHCGSEVHHSLCNGVTFFFSILCDFTLFFRPFGWSQGVVH